MDAKSNINAMPCPNCGEKLVAGKRLDGVWVLIPAKFLGPIYSSEPKEEAEKDDLS
jgi:hypothetical protein